MKTLSVLPFPTLSSTACAVQHHVYFMLYHLFYQLRVYVAKEIQLT